MSDVNVAKLKSRLSEYVRRARRGETITVMSRDIPVARLVPVAPGREALSVRRPSGSGPQKPGRFRLPPPLHTGIDVVALLLEERENGR